MKTITAIAAHKLGNFLTKDFRRIFGSAHDDDAERLGSAARATIECLARSDALYHNYEHTLQVTMVGCDILHGMMVSRRIEPADYGHLIVACLLHDIGYVRGILSGDTETEFVIDDKGNKITLPRGASDAALTPYHVDRSKLFAFERLEKVPNIDAARIADAIEMTRFPVPKDRSGQAKASSRNWCRPPISSASSAIPCTRARPTRSIANSKRSASIGSLGYSSPADIIEKYPSFFWNCVSMHLEDGMKYLNMTTSGRQWIANLHHHILCAERAQRMMGPQG